MSAGIYIKAEDVRRNPFRVSVTPLPSLYDGPMRFPDSGVVLTPRMANEASKGLVWADDILGYVSYPARSVFERGPQPPAAALDGLLGIQRTQILQALRRPTSRDRRPS
jgi:hypothetical protein